MDKSSWLADAHMMCRHLISKLSTKKKKKQRKTREQRTAKPVDLQIKALEIVLRVLTSEYAIINYR